ncbi:hypothetical protein M9434_001871 [Picochlorum sp. BPE23]|nr:hypothetical protein M9434_001871 [Picochlorum sp. BPE23]
MKTSIESPFHEARGTPGSASKNPSSKSFTAYDDTKKARVSQLSNVWKIWMVCGDCFLIGLAPVLVHMAKDEHGTYSFSPVSVNLLVEIAKTIFALGTLVMYGSGRPGPPLYKSISSFYKDAYHNRLLAIPAALYAVNNYLKFVMQLYFKPTTAKMLSNLKIFVIALLMRSVLRRQFSVFQWEALFLLVAGITVNQLSSCEDSKYADIMSPAAVLYTLGSITIPSLASVYNEFALKKNMETSVLLQNFFLYFYGACFNVVGVILLSLFGGIDVIHNGLFAGFTTVTFALIVNNAFQGILSSFFFKFADTILKKYSSTIATILTGLMSAALFGHPLTLNFVIGVSVVFISMHLFFSLGGTKGQPTITRQPTKSSSMQLSPSMDHIALSRQGYDDISFDQSASLGSLGGGEVSMTSIAKSPDLLPR